MGNNQYININNNFLLEDCKRNENFENGFNCNGFIQYINDNFNIDNYSFSIILNVINYAHENYHIRKDDFVEFLSNIIPDLSLVEISQFCEKKILSKETIEETEKWIKSNI